MIRIDISGMADGGYEFDLKSPVRITDCTFEEFFGDIAVNVNVTKLGLRYKAKIHAEVFAKMICDRSLKEFEEKIISNFDLVFRADTKLFLQTGKDGNNDNEIIIREDSKYIDLTNEVIENLALELPMKRIAPEFRDVEIEKIFPEISSDRIIKDTNVDERWSKLKDFKIN